jgi:UDP-N-acetylmuramate dehydrogenase
MSAPAIRGEVRRGEPLASHTTLRVGGPAAWFLLPADEAALIAAFAWARAEGLPCWSLGNGSNLLAPDEGVEGCVIATAPGCHWVRWQADGVAVGAGYPVQRLLNEAARHGLSGLEGLAGVPGTVGGAVVMNAGTAAGETAAVVESVRVLLPSGEVAEWGPAELAFGYRSSRLQAPGHVALSARLRLRPDDPAAIRRELRARARRRRDTQPLELPNAGSIWTNPPGDHAGRLVEAAGCKGLRIGGAMVSPKHANFIVNVGAATAADVLAVMRAVRQRVRERFGVTLEPEIRWMLGQEDLLARLEA